ncbi:B12-binding domain-containing radical SAM protein, partial [Candidatus Omnitrophota bacterium]
MNTSYDMILIMAPPWGVEKPPLGIAYIAEYLKSRNFSVKVIDFNLRLFQAAGENKRIFWEVYNLYFMHFKEISKRMSEMFKTEINDLVNEIVSLDSPIIGFSVNTASICLAAKIAALIKKKDKEKTIIFGGTGCFYEHDRSSLLSEEDILAIDAFVIGEGEQVLENILKRGIKDFRGIEGVIYQKEDFFKPATPYYTKNIACLTFPTFSDFDLNSYTEKRIPMLTSRGCIGRCTFCIDYLICGNYRYRSPEKILEEIKYHVEINKISHFDFNDLICNGNLKQLAALCELIIQSKLNITWTSYAMVRKDMSYELLNKMRRSGCTFICYGLESGSDRILKKMNKFYNSFEAEQVIRRTYKAGITTSINIIVGFPGETKDDFNETITFIKRNKDYILEVTNVSSFIIMLPSELAKHLQEYRIKFLFPKNLDLYIDENGVDHNERITRVRKTIFTLFRLGIKSVIVNQVRPKEKLYHNRVVLVSPPPAKNNA